MASHKKVDCGTKRLLKEKVVQMYDNFFQGEDVFQGNSVFWEELFLLRPNTSKLQNEICNLSDERILELRFRIKRFLDNCIDTLNHKHHIRVLYALQTLCALISSIYKLKRDRRGVGGHDFDVWHTLVGCEEAEKSIRKLVYRCHEFLNGNWPNSLKSVCLKLLLIITTGTDNINQNILLDYLMTDSIFDCLINLIGTAENRQIFGYDVVILLTLLANYKKYEIVNPYVVKLSILDDELPLNGYGLVVAHTLATFCQQNAIEHSEQSSIKWFSSLSNIVGNIFVTVHEEKMGESKTKTDSAVLLALYDIVHLNRNFVSILARSRTDVESEYSLSTGENEGDKSPNDAIISGLISEPLNILTIVLQYCSIVMRNVKSEEWSRNVKLCFLLLTCVAEDQYANSFMHDFQTLFKVRLYRAPSRHRNYVRTDKSPQPLASSVLDLLTEFMISHLMKLLPIELYKLSIGIVCRLLCYQKKCAIRINHEWKELWEALIMVLKFLFDNNFSIGKMKEVFELGTQIIDIFNLFITYGDTFLASPFHYDLLYYEIIRMRAVFETVYTFSSKYSPTKTDACAEPISRIINGLINIRAIINHFSPKIEKWISEYSCSPTEDEILKIIRKNYDSLTLKLLDNLDQYARYSEKSLYAPFFASLLRSIIIDTRQSIDYASFNVHTILREFSSIT